MMLFPEIYFAELTVEDPFRCRACDERILGASSNRRSNDQLCDRCRRLEREEISQRGGRTR